MLTYEAMPAQYGISSSGPVFRVDIAVVTNELVQ